MYYLYIYESFVFSMKTTVNIYRLSSDPTFPTFLVSVLYFLLFLKNSYFFVLYCRPHFQNAVNCCESVHIACVM